MIWSFFPKPQPLKAVFNERKTKKINNWINLADKTSPVKEYRNKYNGVTVEFKPDSFQLIDK